MSAMRAHARQAQWREALSHAEAVNEVLKGAMTNRHPCTPNAVSNAVVYDFLGQVFRG